MMSLSQENRVALAGKYGLKKMILFITNSRVKLKIILHVILELTGFITEFIKFEIDILRNEMCEFYS